MAQKPKSGMGVHRVILFKGLTDHGALITQLHDGFETVTKLYVGESATRTLLNLCNLHAVRGKKDPTSGEVILNTSMSGPHDYFGWLDPTKAFTIQMTPLVGGNGLEFRPVFFEHPVACVGRPRLSPVPVECVERITDYTWIKGSDLAKAPVSSSSGRPTADPVYSHLVDVDSGAADSLFDGPGFLLLPKLHLTFNVIEEPWRMDLILIGPKSSPTVNRLPSTKI